MNPAYVRVTIAGQNTHQSSEDAILDSVEVVHEVNQHSTAVVMYRQSPDRRIPVEDWVGQRMEIYAVGEDGTEAILFAGPIREVLLDFEPAGFFRATIHGVSKSWLMDIARRYRTHQGKPLSANLQKLAGENDNVLERNLPEGDRPVPIIQYRMTDYELFRHVVDTAGCCLRTRPTGLDIFNAFTESGVTLKWRAERSLAHFRLRGAISPHAVSSSHYDLATMESGRLTEVTQPAEYFFEPAMVASALGRSRDLKLVDYYSERIHFTSQARQRTRLEMEARRSIGAQVYGVGESGDAGVDVGASLEIDGLEGMAGRWGVMKVTHRWTPAGYINEFVCTTVSKPLAAVPALPGPLAQPVRARVTDNATDGNDRVRVRFPWEKDDDALISLSIASPHCGAGRGIYFKPEVGDDVIVGFIEGLAMLPYVMGAAWNGVEHPPIDALFGGEFGNNDIKRIVTKSGNRVVMDDKDGQETIVVATPNHVRVSLFDGGQTLVLHSDGNIHIHAGGTVQIKCAQFLREVG